MTTDTVQKKRIRWSYTSYDSMHVVTVLEDATISDDDPLWVCGHEFGPTHLIKAPSFDAAFEELLDNSPAIDDTDIPEAFGFDSLEDFQHADQNTINLVEGYYFMPNFGGTNGIVNLGHYWWMQEYTGNN